MPAFDYILFDQHRTMINGDDWDFDVTPFSKEIDFVEWVVSDVIFKRTCDYCSSRFVTSQDSFESVAYLRVCDTCGFWQCYYDQHKGPNHAFISKVREFETALPEPCLSEIAQMIRRKQHIWHTLDPRRLEELVADVFRANHAHSEVLHVGKPDDGGVDVIFIDSEQTQWLIQVKRREKHSASEGVSTVRNLLGAMLLNDKFNGIVVSTADHFTYRAYQAVNRASEKGMHLQLIDRGKLNRMLDPLIPSRPWATLLKPFVEEELIEFLLRSKQRRREIRKAWLSKD